jgi:nitrogenase molybdenum-iron protein NifN
VNPLKQSPTLGGTLAFLGLDRCMPILHGSQGCTAFAKSLLVRHFREAIPLQTSALTELTVIMGGEENLVEALKVVAGRQQPAVIGVMSTALTETRGDDIPGAIREFRRKHPEFASVGVVFAPTPDWCGSLEQGYARAVTAMVEALVPDGRPTGPAVPGQVNILAGSHLTVADVLAVKELVAAFGLTPLVLPDLSGSLDGHTPDDYSPLTLGGTTLAQIGSMGRSEATLALGDSMRPAAAKLGERTGVPYHLFPSLTGLSACDSLVDTLMAISGRTAPAAVRRERRQLQDTMLDCHFIFGGKRAALALEPDLLYGVSMLLQDLGVTIGAALAPVQTPLLTGLPWQVQVGDLADLEALAHGADLIVSNSHARHAAGRLGIPLCRMGIPVWDRLGAQWQRTVGYRGTAALLTEIGNLWLEREG